MIRPGRACEPIRSGPIRALHVTGSESQGGVPGISLPNESSMKPRKTGRVERRERERSVPDDGS